MSILERIRRVARANLHDLLDKVDTPEMEVQSRIDELHQALGEARRALAGFAVTHRQLDNERQQLEREQETMQSRAEDALRDGREDSTRALLAEKIKVRNRLQKLVPSVERSAATYEEMKGNLVALNEQLKAARLKLAELRSRKRAAVAQQTADEKLEQARSTAASGGGFDRLEDEVLEVESDVEIQQEIRAELAGVEQKCEAQAVEAGVEDELSALKRKIAETD